MSKEETIKKISKTLEKLHEFELNEIDGLVEYLSIDNIKTYRPGNTDIATEEFVHLFGFTLKLHHFFSLEPFTKDKFEFALVKTLKMCGWNAELAPKGNPGYDLTANKDRVSLKTQADKSIKLDRLHISKYMELGKGKWEDEEDLKEFVKRFLIHMDNYDRIFSLRCLEKESRWSYELVEIPKKLLQESKDGEISMKHDSKQNPKPGYCVVPSKGGEIKYKLYFDGGGERKLQVKDLKKSYCKVHAAWTLTPINQRGRN